MNSTSPDIHIRGSNVREARARAYAEWARIDEKNWQPLYTKILLMTHAGKSLPDIMAACKVSMRTVTRVRASTYFIQKLSHMHTRVIEMSINKTVERVTTDRARDALSRASLRAARVVIRLTKHGNPVDKVKLEAAKDILDRVGLKGVQVVETREAPVSVEDAERIKGVLEEINKLSARLTNQSSPFLLGGTDSASSVTDHSSDDTQDSEDTPDGA